MQRVTDPSILAELNGAPAQAPRQPAQQAPVFIPNRAGQRADGRAEAANQRAEAAEARAAEAEARAAEEFARKQRAAGITGGVDTTEAEKTAAFLATRVAGGLETLSKLKDTGPEIDASIASWFGETARNALNSEERQRIEAAQLDILDAALTLGTGAAYTKEQLEGYRRAYFPQLFDSDRTIADKRDRLSLALEAARVKSGAAAPQIDRALAAAGFAAPASNGEPPPDEEPTGPVMLPRAAGAHDQGGADIDGVTPKGKGNRPEPKLYHLGNTVADMIARGDDEGQIRQYLDEQYAPYGVTTSTPMMAKVGEVIAAHRKAPNSPIKSLIGGWDNFHMVPDQAEPTIVGQIADSTIGAGVLGAADIATAGFGDEIAGAIGGDELNAAWDYSQKERPKTYMAGQLLGSLILPTKAGNVAKTAGVRALRSGEGMAAARVAASRAGSSRMAKEAGAYGAAHGFGSAEGDLGDRLSGAAVEGGLGLVGGKSLGALGGKIASGRRASAASRAADEDLAGADDAAEYIAAADRQGVTPFVGDVDTRAAALSGKLAQLQSSLGPITKAAKKTVSSAKSARDRIARAVGIGESGEALGHRIAEGAQKAVAREHDQAQSLYKAAERQSEGVRVKPAQAFQTISDEIDKIADTGGGGQALGVFKRYQDRMTQGPMSVETLRNVRTQLREDLATEGLRGGTANASARRVMEAITEDIDSTLRTNGLGETADLFKRADESWAAYTDLTDNVIAPLIGKNGEFSGEQVVKKLQSDLRGNNARAAHLLRALPAEEQRIVRASVIRSLGHAPNGQQGADGDTFSLARFLTQWNEIGDSAKEAYFGAETRSALNDLAKVADGAKQSQRWANHSNSAGGVNLPAEVVGGIMTAGLSVAVPHVSAKLLTSQRVIRWLASAAKKPNAKALESHVKRLASVADAEPALANEILGLQQRFMESLTRSPVPVHADEKHDGRVKPPEQGAADDRP